MSWLAGDLKQWKPQTLCVLRAEAEAENHLKPARERLDTNLVHLRVAAAAFVFRMICLVSVWLGSR